MPLVVQFNPVVKNGSTGRITELIGNIAISRGWDSVIVYSGRPKNNSNSRLIQCGNYFDSVLHALETRLFDRHGLGSRRATKRLVKQLSLIKPDILHFHNIHGYYLNYGILTKYIVANNIPVVWTFHDFWPITGHCSYFSDIDCEKWVNQCNSCPKISYYPKSFGLDNSKNNYNLKKNLFSSISNLTIVPVSKWAASLVHRSFLKDKRVSPIYNGVDLSVFKPKGHQQELKLKYGFDSNTKVLLALATTWGKRKGWFDYMKLVDLLPKDIKIVLVGVTQKQKEELPKAIITMARTESVIHLAELYSLADIVMNLSYQETFGLTTVEGFACGTPSIVYNCTASPELMTKDVGELVEPGDLDGVVKAIDSVLKNGKNYYSNNCIIRAKQLFSHTDRFNDYIDLYEEIISSK